MINMSSLHPHTIFYTDRSYPLPSWPCMNKCLYVIILALKKPKTLWSCDEEMSFLADILPLFKMYLKWKVRHLLSS